MSIWAEATILSTSTLKAWCLTCSMNCRHICSNAFSLETLHLLTLISFSKVTYRETQIVIWIPHLSFMRPFTHCSFPTTPKTKKDFSRDNFLSSTIIMYFSNTLSHNLLDLLNLREARISQNSPKNDQKCMCPLISIKPSNINWAPTMGKILGMAVVGINFCGES